MQPFKQGDLDGFCGVYSVINAVHYICGPLSLKCRSRLFRLFLEYLEPRHSLLERADGDGVLLNELSGMLNIALKYHPISRQKRFHKQPDIPFEDYWTQCQEFLTEPNSIILICLEGMHSHWTLVHKMTDSQMYLFDSSNLKQIHKRHCQMSLDEEDKPHYFYATHTYFIRRKTMNKPFIASDKTGEYVITRPVDAEDILTMAKQLISRKYARGRLINSPKEAASYFPHKLSEFEYETFWALFLDNQHRVLAFEKLFTGTIDQASVYPREVLKRALQLNAKAIIFAHNHPSGQAEPSQCDIQITQKLKQALAIVDINVLDHFVVAADNVTSMAELGHC